MRLSCYETDGRIKMDDKQIRILKAMYDRTGGNFGAPFNPFMFQPGSGYTESEFATFLDLLKKREFIQLFGETGPDIMFTQRGLDWIAGEFNGKNQQKHFEFLQAVDTETKGGEIQLDQYILKLGEHFGLETAEVIELIRQFHSKGYIRLTGSGSNTSISVTRLGRTAIVEILGDVNRPGNNGTGAQYKLFISHISEHESIAQKLKDFLTSVFGENIHVFVAGDPDSIPFSKKWYDEIKSGIENCDLMIILCTPDSVKRPWINFEAGAAEIKNKNIGPVCFGGLSPGSLPSPLNYIQGQAMNCGEATRFKVYFDNLQKTIADQVGCQIMVKDVLLSEFYQALSSTSSPSTPVQ